MAFPRKRRHAFTLTEMLMAAGILGIGLTMVASIFPVAVDQSRRSRDQTMAALCARSVMARARADQNAFSNLLRGRTDGTFNLAVDAPGLLSVVYKPSVFLYTKDRTYAGVSTWDGGNYVARLFASRTSIDGPWRLSIFVCRAIGIAPTNSTDIYKWDNLNLKPPPGPGTYVYENSRGCIYGHLLDYVTIDPAGLRTGYPAVGVTSGASWPPDIIRPTTTFIQYMPDAVAVFHTILGE